MPVQASTDFKLVLNLATASEQGVTFPVELLAIANDFVGLP